MPRNTSRADEFDDFDSEDLPSTSRSPRFARRTSPPARFRPGRAQTRRGRLTEEERALLAGLREEPVEQSLPGDADRWSTWDTGERGPRPYPHWLVTSLAAVDHELGGIKTGKEADVVLLRRSVPPPDDSVAAQRDSCLLAAKRYRTSDHRLFHRDAGYLEGRRTRKSRETRAAQRRTSFGKGLIAEQWASAEFHALGRLWSLGAPVPYPVQRVGMEVLLEFVGTPDGVAAPRLASLRPDPDVTEELWRQLLDALVLLAEHGLAHGDLSAYNILVTGPETDPSLVLIDLPQIVDLVANPQGPGFLHRDVSTITAWFRSHGLAAHLADPDEVTEQLTQAAGMR